MGVRRISGKLRLILTSFVLALSSISPFTPKYELYSLYMSYMVIYMSGSTPYNDVEVMCSEQSAGSICMEGAVRTEAPASDAEAVS